MANMSHESRSTNEAERVADLPPSTGDPYDNVPSPILTDSARRRSLDDMRRLSEEIKWERARAHIRPIV